MQVKPRNPYPLLVRRFLRKVLPYGVYRRYIGRHEDESMRLWKRIAANVPSDKVILDIGAYHGVFALAAKEVNPGVMVYTFEPNPHTVEMLRQACAKSDIEIRELAIAEFNGAVPFLCASAQSRIVTDPSTSQEQGISVPAVSLDTWITDSDVVPSLIKIDTEGAEAAILRGAKKLLMEYQPIILCEILTDAAGEDVMAALPSHYHYLYINENTGVIEKSRITRDRWRNKNWLLIPENRLPEA